MKAKDFIIVRRPMLAKMIEHPVVGFSDYERRLKSMRSVMQSIQQACRTSPPDQGPPH
jgi:hypothetical protein